MKTIRTSLLSKSLSCFLAFLVLFVSCSTPDGNVILENESSFQNMSGEQVFRSILFKEGDFGKQLFNEDDINIINNMDSQILTAFENTKNEITALIKKEKPYYFNQFKSKILSKNHITIFYTLKDSRTLIQETIKKLYSITDNDIKEKTKSMNKENLLNDLKNKDAFESQKAIAIVFDTFVVWIWILIAMNLVLSPLNDTAISKLENELIVIKIISNI